MDQPPSGSARRRGRTALAGRVLGALRNRTATGEHVHVDAGPARHGRRSRAKGELANRGDGRHHAPTRTVRGLATRFPRRTGAHRVDGAPGPCASWPHRDSRARAPAPSGARLVDRRRGSALDGAADGSLEGARLPPALRSEVVAAAPSRSRPSARVGHEDADAVGVGSVACVAEGAFVVGGVVPGGDVAAARDAAARPCDATPDVPGPTVTMAPVPFGSGRPVIAYTSEPSTVSRARSSSTSLSR